MATSRRAGERAELIENEVVRLKSVVEQNIYNQADWSAAGAAAAPQANPTGTSMYPNSSVHLNLEAPSAGGVRSPIQSVCRWPGYIGRS